MSDSEDNGVSTSTRYRRSRRLAEAGSSDSDETDLPRKKIHTEPDSGTPGSVSENDEPNIIDEESLSDNADRSPPEPEAINQHEELEMHADSPPLGIGILDPHPPIEELQEGRQIENEIPNILPPHDSPPPPSPPDSDIESDDAETDEEIDLDPHVSDDDEEDQQHDPLLYRGAPITVAQSLLAILCFVIAHNCTGVALADLLTLIALHCIAEDNLCKKTLYKFKKYFEKMDAPVKLHYFCSKCFRKLESKTDQCTTEGCIQNTPVSYFIEISIIGQLRRMYNRAGFWKKLNYKSERIKKNAHAYEDIYDGKCYKDAVRDGFLSERSNISFLWNTDGVRIFKSAKYELWPFYLAINELPYSERFKIENMLVAGLWFGPTKPVLPMFLNAFHDDLSNLHQGVEFDVFDQNGKENVRACVLCGTCDTPAKSHFLNLTSHNGYHGCPKCKVRGERSERTNSKHAYVFGNDSLRTQNETDQYARLAETHNVTFYGIKGVSALSMFVENYIISTSVDVMHAVFQGVQKTLMNLWFDQEFSRSAFSLYAVREAISLIFVELTPPAYIRRLPRSISETLKLWKAAEFKSWLFYYCLPVLSGVMSPEYFNHLMLLVHAMYLLNNESVSEEMIDEADICLREFVVKFQDLYGYEYLSINFHLLLHLAENVRNLGPLWASSCMPFEDLNGQIKVLVHGTCHAALQITSSFGQLISLPIMLSKLPEQDNVRLWCERILKKEKLSIVEIVSNSIATVGSYVYLRRDDLPPIIFDALNDSDLFPCNVVKFFKLKKGRVIFTGDSYTRAKATYSSAVRFWSGNEYNFGVIRSFVRLSNCECNVECRCRGTYYAILTRLEHVNPFRIIHPDVTLTYIMECTLAQGSEAVPVENLQCPCVRIKTHNKMYVIKPVNTIELE